MTNTDEQNPPNSVAILVCLVAREGVPDVMWACVWCLLHRLPHQSKCVNHPYILNSVGHDTIVIQGATDLWQQPELCE